MGRHKMVTKDEDSTCRWCPPFGSQWINNSLNRVDGWKERSPMETLLLLWLLLLLSICLMQKRLYEHRQKEDRQDSSPIFLWFCNRYSDTSLLLQRMLRGATWYVNHLRLYLNSQPPPLDTTATLDSSYIQSKSNLSSWRAGSNLSVNTKWSARRTWTNTSKRSVNHDDVIFFFSFSRKKNMICGSSSTELLPLNNRCERSDENDGQHYQGAHWMRHRWRRMAPDDSHRHPRRHNQV